ncbi:MAG: nitroreductase family protein [Oscillospiraceae bacterium]|nr:nitroreductase family protein [Oscillospiraceae bacterium]
MLKEITERRSVRKFKPNSIPKAAVEEIILAGILAPSAKNRQPWRFTITEGKSKAELCEIMEAGLKRERISPLLPESAGGIADAEHTLSIMRQAPLLIFITDIYGSDLTAHLTADEHEFELCNTLSIGAAIQNMILTAQNLGIGSLWICNTCFAQRELNAALGSELRAVLALGYPAESPPPRPRKKIEEITEWRNQI